MHIEEEGIAYVKEIIWGILMWNALVSNLPISYYYLTSSARAKIMELF